MEDCTCTPSCGSRLLSSASTPLSLTFPDIIQISSPSAVVELFEDTCRRAVNSFPPSISNQFVLLGEISFSYQLGRNSSPRYERERVSHKLLLTLRFLIGPSVLRPRFGPQRSADPCLRRLKLVHTVSAVSPPSHFPTPRCPRRVCLGQHPSAPSPAI